LEMREKSSGVVFPTLEMQEKSSEVVFPTLEMRKKKNEKMGRFGFSRTE
jgi:hypothetical protein